MFRWNQGLVVALCATSILLGIDENPRSCAYAQYQSPAVQQSYYHRPDHTLEPDEFLARAKQSNSESVLEHYEKLLKANRPRHSMQGGGRYQQANTYNQQRYEIQQIPEQQSVPNSLRHHPRLQPPQQAPPQQAPLQQAPLQQTGIQKPYAQPGFSLSAPRISNRLTIIGQPLQPIGNIADRTKARLASQRIILPPGLFQDGTIPSAMPVELATMHTSVNHKRESSRSTKTLTRKIYRAATTRFLNHHLTFWEARIAIRTKTIRSPIRRLIFYRTNRYQIRLTILRRICRTTINGNRIKTDLPIHPTLILMLRILFRVSTHSQSLPTTSILTSNKLPTRTKLNDRMMVRHQVIHRINLTRLIAQANGTEPDRTIPLTAINPSRSCLHLQIESSRITLNRTCNRFINTNRQTTV